MSFSPRQTSAAFLLVVAALTHAPSHALSHALGARSAGDSSARLQRPGGGEGKAAGRKQPASKGDVGSRRARERRQALALLLETAEAARSVEEIEDRLELLALAADALWPHDERGARAVFMRAWETAVALDNEVRRGEDSNARPGEETEAVTDARLDLLARLARHDPQLTERLLKDLIREAERPEKAESASPDGAGGGGEQGGTQNAARRRSPWRELSPAGARRFELAAALMQEGDYERAAQVAAPLAAEVPSAQLMTLLHDLRPRAAKGADEIYGRLLGHTLNDASADANDLLLLSSYVVSPELLIVVDAQGSLHYRSLTFRDSADAGKPRPEVPANLRALLYRIVAAVISRPAAARPEPMAGDTVAPFVAIERVLPWVEREAPQVAHALHARRATLSQEIDAARRERLVGQATVRDLARKNPADPLARSLEAATRATGGEADIRRLHAVLHAARLRLWERAHTIAAEITDATLRQKALSAIATRQVLAAGEDFKEDDDPEDWRRAADFVRAADVSPLVRALGLAQVAELAAHRGQRERAAELIRDAAAFAEQAGPGALEQFAAAATLAIAASRVDAAQTWGLLASAVRAANGIDQFTPTRTVVLEPLLGDDGHLPPVGGAESPSPDDVFAAAARLDFARAVAEARTLKAAAIRAYALLAAARAALERNAGGVRAGAERK